MLCEVVLDCGSFDIATDSLLIEHVDSPLICYSCNLANHLSQLTIPFPRYPLASGLIFLPN